MFVAISFLIPYSTWPILSEISLAKNDVHNLRSDIDQWRWIEAVDLPKPSSQPDNDRLASISLAVEKLNADVQSCAVHLSNLTPSQPDGSFTIQVQGSYSNLMKFLDTIKNSSYEVSSIMKSPEGMQLAATLTMRTVR